MNHARAPRKEKRHRQSKFANDRNNRSQLRALKRMDTEPMVELDGPQVRAHVARLRRAAPKLAPAACPYGHNAEMTCPICDQLE